MRALVLGTAAVFPVTFTALTAWAASSGNAPGMLAGGLLAAIEWAVWVFLATWLRPRRKRARWSRKEAAALEELLDAPPKRGRR